MDVVVGVAMTTVIVFLQVRTRPCTDMTFWHYTVNISTGSLFP